MNILLLNIFINRLLTAMTGLWLLWKELLITSGQSVKNTVIRSAHALTMWINGYGPDICKMKMFSFVENG